MKFHQIFFRVYAAESDAVYLTLKLSCSSAEEFYNSIFCGFKAFKAWLPVLYDIGCNTSEVLGYILKIIFGIYTRC